LEDGVSGEIPIADQIDGKSALGYHRGLVLVGTQPIQDRGANFAMAWVGSCAYVTTTSATQLFGATNNPYVVPSNNVLNGMAVIDVSNPANPKLVSILQSPAMLDPHESLQGNDARHIIVGTSSSGNNLDVYDASDCTHPVLKASIQIGPGINADVTQGITFRGHAMCLSPDGTMAYATGTPFNNAAIDLTNLSNPVVKQLFVPAAHDCDVSPDGNRLYLAVYGGAAFGTAGLILSPTGQILDSVDGDLPPYGTSNFNGMLVLDSSQFQAHAASPHFSVIGQLQWTPEGENEVATAGSHTSRYFVNNGHPYLYSSDEWPVFNSCPWGHGRILDISDETAPTKIADITLGVQEQSNCLASETDDANYSAHYAGIDSQSNAKLLFTTEYAGGLRVYDIGNPYSPVEIAYYHPAPIFNEPLATGSQVFGSDGTGWEAVPTYVHYVPSNGDIWAVGFTTGFNVFHLSRSAGPMPALKARKSLPIFPGVRRIL
jgi:hypothetical protein